MKYRTRTPGKLPMKTMSLRIGSNSIILQLQRSISPGTIWVMIPWTSKNGQSPPTKWLQANIWSFLHLQKTELLHRRTITGRAPYYLHTRSITLFQQLPPPPTGCSLDLWLPAGNRERQVLVLGTVTMRQLFHWVQWWYMCANHSSFQLHLAIRTLPSTLISMMVLWHTSMELKLPVDSLPECQPGILQHLHPVKQQCTLVANLTVLRLIQPW